MLSHKGTITIQTPRLTLRKYHESDLADIYQNYATDERVTQYLSWQPYPNIESLKEFVSLQIASYTNQTYNWVIEYEHQVIGSISALVEERNESCEIGYCLGHAFWNQGLATEALTAIIAFLFEKVGFHRIMAKHDLDNPASGKVMQKCNMVYEARLREYFFRHDGVFADALIYSILKSEFSKP